MFLKVTDEDYKVENYKVENSITYKWCNICKSWKTLDVWYKDSSRIDKLGYCCKECYNKKFVKLKGTTKKIDHKFENGIEVKFCRQCSLWFPLSSFNKETSKWDNLSSVCSSCNITNYHRWKKDNPNYDIDYYRENTEERLEYSKKWRSKNPDKVRGYTVAYNANPKNKETINKNCKIRRSTLRGKLDDFLTSGVWGALKGTKGRRAVESLVKYTITDLESSLDLTMPEKYTWDDYVERKKGDPKKLQVDHIIAKNLWIYECPEDMGFKMCWSLENLQLLPAFQNQSKHNKVGFMWRAVLSSLQKKYNEDPLLFLNRIHTKDENNVKIDLSTYKEKETK